MNPDFWLQMWDAQQIGFHEKTINPLLLAHWSEVGREPGRVFVPLCGKSLDLLWLEAEGYSVAGNEIASEAVDAFFREAERPVTAKPRGALGEYQAGDITIWCGNFFDISTEVLGDIDYVYDRGALVALPAAMRADYVRHMATLIPAGARELLITLEYDQSSMDGPPFSITADEVQRLYSDRCEIRQLASDGSALAKNEKFRSRGINSLIETVYLLEWN